MSSKGMEKCNSDSESHDQESEKELGIPLQKLNLEPKRKKLLVMNLNGLLLYKVHFRANTKTRIPDQTPRFLNLYKRPYSEEFMKFCFERFEVGLWSSSMQHNIHLALDCAMGSLSSKLLFIWDQKECSNSGFSSLENRRKPLFLKELNNVFVKINKGGTYSELNTLLIDDKPYRALLNPPNTAIFPEPYNPENENDNALDPDGELCKYLKGVADADDVQTYVKDHPFGQPAITSSHPDWCYYGNVKHVLMKKRIVQMLMVLPLCVQLVSTEKLKLGPKKKKLLVMSLNGFLLKRVHCSDKSGILASRKPDSKQGNFSLYKRPFSEEFMKFCLERFEVGVWATAMEHNIGAALTCAMGSLSNKLLFTWDQDQCTRGGGQSLENDDKRMFFKNLNKVFDTITKGGPYSISNTLMIDDKPYKALLNPPYTAIFPESYKPENRNDNALDPNGELCMYLKGVADAFDVQWYVKDHPFGQPAITKSHPDWLFYSMVVNYIHE